MTENIAYYAIIPASVRYDKSISAGAKLLYGEITALCNQEGFCWATNTYFESLYEVCERTIQRWINSLVEAGYIAKNIEYEEDKKTVIRRCLSISMSPAPVKNVTTPPVKNVTTPPVKNVGENNTSMNNTSMNISDINISLYSSRHLTAFRVPSFYEVQAYCQERKNNINPQQFIDFYTAKGWRVGKTPMKDWRAAIRNWEHSRNKADPPSNQTTSKYDEYDRDE